MTSYKIDDNWSGRAPSIKEIAGKVVSEAKRQLAINASPDFPLADEDMADIANTLTESSECEASRIDWAHLNGELQREMIESLAIYPDRESEARESCRRLGLDESEWRKEAEELRVLRVRLGVLEGRG